MIVVRYLALAALAVWIGGLSVVGFLVAPMVLRTAHTSDPSVGRLLSDVFVGGIVRRFNLLAYVCGASLFVSLLVIKFVGPPPRAFKLRAALVALMLAIALYSGIPLAREMTAIQSQVAGLVTALPDTDPRRSRFERLQEVATTLMAANVALGLVLLSWYVRE